MVVWELGQTARPREEAEPFGQSLEETACNIIGLSECQAESEDVLKRKPAAVAAAAKPRAKCKFNYRPEFKYLTLRGREPESVLIAVRDEPGCALQMLDFERRDEGLVKRKGKRNNGAGHTLAA